jgi:hypothetical protein
MSPYQRVSTAHASTVKSRPMRSGRAVAAGSATVVVCHRRGAATVQAGGAHRAGDAFAAVPVAGRGEFGVDPWCAVGAGRGVVDRGDPYGQIVIDVPPW